MKYYEMTGATAAEHVLPGEALGELLDACESGNTQLLNREALDVEISLDGGTEFPDFLLYQNVIPLISPRLYTFLNDQSQVFFKPINLIRRELGIKEPFWLALPPRIDCLDWEACAIRENANPNFPFWARFHKAESIVIDPDKTGRYDLFKLPWNMLNQEIIVTEKLKDKLIGGSFDNLYFYPLE